MEQDCGTVDSEINITNIMTNRSLNLSLLHISS
jgi:hypothetical protein